MPWTRILYALFAAYVAATALHIGFVMAHEPFAFDAWNVAIDTHSEPFSIGRWLDYWGYEYTHSNPRLGQGLAYLAYKLEYFAVIATPLAYLAITFAVTTLGLGRWPRHGRDLALWAISIGFGWFVFPELGRNMFNRAYGANYVYGVAIQLWFLVPLRLAKDFGAGASRAVAYGVFGAVAGLCNEHTGPVVLATLAIIAWKRRAERPRLVWAGAIGFGLGFAAIFFAPGQGERYGGLATKTGLLMRLVQRGVIGMIDIVGDYIQYAAPLLVLITIALILALIGARGDDIRRSARLVGLALVLGLGLAITLWVSPKLGSRFYLLSAALLLAATIAIVEAVASRKQLAGLVAIAVFASGFAAARTIPLYSRVAEQSDARLAALAATGPGDVFVADAFDQSDESWWFIGDDFDDPLKRERVASYLALARVTFRGFELQAPLGAAGVQVAGHYQLAGQSCDAEDAELDLEGKGLDVVGIINVTRIAISRFASRELLHYELAVGFPGKPPELPRPHIVVARYEHGRLVDYAGSIVRPGASLAREIKAPPLPAGFELYVWQLGGEYRRLDDARFTPWRTGLYWALACDAHECWVIAAARGHAG